MGFNCETCDKEFSSKVGLTYHLTHKSCKITDKCVCEYCGKEYTTKQSMNRHIKYNCKKKNEINNNLHNNPEMEMIYEQLLALKIENEKLKEKVLTIEKENDTKQTNNSITTNKSVTKNINYGNIQYNFNLVAHGNEDMSKMDKNDIIKAFKSGFNSTLELTEAMHFNPKYPEFHNIYISSMKNQYAMIYNGTDWVLVMKDDLIDRLYNRKRDYIEENLDEFVGSLSKSQKNAIHRWLNANENHSYIKKIKNDMKLLLYNKRFMAINYRNQQMDIIKSGESTVEEIIDHDDYKDTTNMKVIKEPKVYVSDAHIIEAHPRIVKCVERSGTKRKVIKNTID